MRSRLMVFTGLLTAASFSVDAQTPPSVSNSLPVSGAGTIYAPPAYVPPEIATPNNPVTYTGPTNLGAANNTPSGAYPENIAPDAGQPASAGDPQGRVGRISLIDGTVSFHSPDENQWSYAMTNYPVTSGDSFWTEPGARAEMQVGASALRLDANTEADVAELDDHATRIAVRQGTINLHVGDAAEGITYQVVTPRQVVNIMQPGTYRVGAGTDSLPSEIAVLRGEAQVINGPQSVTVGAGETASISPNTGAGTSVLMTNATAFDNWSLQRDNYEEPRRVEQYVSPAMTGYEDLDNYGTWMALANYDQVWFPNNLPAGWEPYREGRWVWVSPWGWTWIDDAPWGFAPFHYGRWAWIDNQWGWIPGRIVHHPIYAPALVAFVGGDKWGVSVDGGHPVGWIPLGPGEPYHPGYKSSGNYLEHVNVANVSDINNAADDHPQHFINRNHMTVVPADVLAHAEDVAANVQKIPPERIADAPIQTTGRPPGMGTHPLMPVQFSEHSQPYIPRGPAPVERPKASTVPQAAPATAARTRQPAAEPAYATEIRTERVAETGAEHAPGPPITHHTEPAQTGVAPQEAKLPHPTQPYPLTPSHQGWVRQPHVEPSHEAPKTETPHTEQHPTPSAATH